LETFLLAIQPHVILKASQVSLALGLQRMIDGLPRRPNGSAMWTEEAKKHGRAIRQQMQELNRKGPAVELEEGWLARRVGDLWLTPQRDLFSPHGWAEFAETWPRSGTVQNGTLYRLPTLVLRTSENAYGSWPTPTAGDAQGSGSRNTPTSNAHAGISLTDAVRGDGGTGRIFPTPRAHRAGADFAWERHGLERFSTPTVQDAKNTAGPFGYERNSLALNAQVGGSLNPQFCEWLLGYPKDWTKVD